MSRTLRSNRMPWRLRLTVVAVIVAAAAAGQSIPGTPASADPAQVCRLTFTVQTGNVSGPEDSIATGQPVDASWPLSYSDGGGVAAYTRMTPGPAIDPVRSYSVTGDTPSIERLGLGWYRVKWEQVGRPYGNVQVTSTATDGSYCHLGLINDYGAPPQLWVDVYCHTPTGARGDSEFGVTYRRRPA